MRVTDDHARYALLQDFLGAIDVALSCEVLSSTMLTPLGTLLRGISAPGTGDMGTVVLGDMTLPVELSPIGAICSAKSGGGVGGAGGGVRFATGFGFG